ncbi:MAG: FAD-binding oxidoreductase [Actinomycetota bacterium]
MSETADLVVVGAGMVGGWASYFAATSGADRVVVIEKGIAGSGASSRAAGVVRAQGGTPATVALGRWSVDFYNRQQDLLGTDSGFRELGYMILAVTQEDEKAGRRRVDMQREQGLGVDWLGPAQACAMNPTLAREGHVGGSYLPTDGCIDPPRNVTAYSLAMQQAGVQLRERTEFRGLTFDGGRVTGVETSAGPIATERVLLTGGPVLQRVGKLVGARIPVGGARHQIAISEPHPAFDVERLPMIFDLGVGLYWRLEDGGLLWGMSNPNEEPGPANEIDWEYLRAMEERLHRLVPVTVGLGIRKVWAATIDYTTDHLPIFGPVITREGATLDGVTVASPAGHGMMWGPAVARVAADLALDGKTDIVDVADLGLSRFDGAGNSAFQDPVALPFPLTFDDD